MNSPICVNNIRVPHRKHVASLKIAGLTLAIAPLGMMLAAANISAQAQTANPADWAQFHRDNMQRWNPYETVLGVTNVGTMGLEWSYVNSTDLYGSGSYSSPAVVNGMVYVSYVNTVYVLNASTGALRWSFATGNVDTSPAVVNGVVYIGSADNNVYALNASTGAKLWSYATGDQVVQSSPAVANGVVYIGSDDGNLYALNASTGAKLWSYSTGTQVISSPAVANGTVYGQSISSVSGNLYAFGLNASTGALQWSYTLADRPTSPPNSSPAVANGVVYIGGNSTVYALNASSGAKLWSYDTGFPVESSPAVANGVVYIGNDNGTMYALNASTGDLTWTYATASFVPSSPAVANGVVYFPSSSGSAANVVISALNASTGAELWSFPIGGNELPSPAVVDGVLYVNSGDSLDAFGLAGSREGADLFLRIEPSPTTVHQGDLITYAFPVWDLGPANAVHEVLTTQVPEGTTFDYIRISGTPGLGTCTTPPYEGTGEIVCHENSAMAPNTTWTVRLVVKVTAPAGTVITESATTTEDTFDPNLANNTATVSMTVQ
jgi:outer membrane protein assembly factor BamB